MKTLFEHAQKTLRLTEIFYSIQGESSFVGMPCIFIRTTGCDLRCEWCDTEYAFYGGKKWTIAEIIRYLQKWPCKLVELTGGEPLLQKNLPALAERLLEQNYTVLIETGGHRDVSVLDRRVIKIMDVKCPGSGESDKNLWQNFDFLEAKDQVKFVIKDRADYEWAKDVMQKYRLENGPHLLLSPVFAVMDYQELAGWILQDGLNARMQLQLHKFIWHPAAKGV
jgi:7-carboxy-7-deazaguanine synthase